MKNSFGILAAMAIFLFTQVSFAETAAAPAVAPVVTAETAAPAAECSVGTEAAGETEEDGGFGTHLFNMGRGVTNIGTCWLEVFRCMLYRNAEVPFFGFVYGACEGAGFTVMRAFTGVTDILFLGFEPANIFEPRFSEFVWESPWQPKKELQFKTPVLPEN
jgi:putative exosortase-associated protein (TIGR04073 family)